MTAPPSWIIVVFLASATICVVTVPVLASSLSCFENVFKMFVLRPIGQKVTSQPPPVGMMKVDV
jgi:hypothetical protein